MSCRSGFGTQRSHEIALLCAVQRTHRGARFQPMPDTKVGEDLRHALHELVVARAMHVDTLDAHADLACGREGSHHESLQAGPIELRVGQDERWVIAAELEG